MLVEHLKNVNWVLQLETDTPDLRAAAMAKLRADCCAYTGAKYPDINVPYLWGPWKGRIALCAVF